MSKARMPAGKPLVSFLAGFAISVLLAGCAGRGPALPLGPSGPLPPVAKRVPHVVESPHGNRTDNYYWMRDDARQAKDVLEYLTAENRYRDAVMAPIASLQQTLYSELVGRLQPDASTVPVYENGWWYYRRYVPEQEYPVYARRKGRVDAPEEVLLDGNALADGKGYFSIGSIEVSPNGKLLAYAEDSVGRGQYRLKVKNLATGDLLPDSIENIETDLVWANDNRTLLYIEKDPVTLLSKRVRAHRLGAAAGDDALVYDEPNSSFYLSLRRSDSGKYLFVESNSTTQSEVRYADASDRALAFKTIVPREAGHLYEAEHFGNDFILRSNLQAPNFRLLRAPVARSADRKRWKDVVPVRDTAFIESFEVHPNHLVINERLNGLKKLRVRPWKSGASDKQDFLIETGEPAYTMTLVPTPGLTSAGGAQKLRYVYSSLTVPPTTYDYDLKRDRNEELKREKVLGGFVSSNYASEFLRAPARDGAEVPVSLVYRKGTPLDGTAPMLQDGYGSYGISNDPEFAGNWLSLLDRGFVIAIAHVRGGQELGRAWYEGGRLLNKNNTFTDFIDVTDFLVQRKVAAPDKVFATGRSAGGLLMGAVANIAPDRYRGIIAGVPFVDVVTTMLDETIPLTTNEFDEWGNPKQAEFYKTMLAYSPYDNVKPRDYPALYVSTGLWDSQVQYYEPAKWVAKLRAMKTDRNPLIFSVDLEAGHGGKSGRYQRYVEVSREYAFMLQQLGLRE